jgi:hypothetical protein
VQSLLDIAGRDALGVQGDDLLLQLVGARLVLVEHRGLKIAVAVARNLDSHLARGGPQITAPLAVAAVPRVPAAGGVGFVAKLGGEFGLQHVLEGAGEQPGEDALLAEEVVDALRAGQLLLDALHRRK